MMLVLARGHDESVIITTAHGERITIRVVQFRPGPKVRLGFEADPSIRIDRDEIDARRKGGAA